LLSPNTIDRTNIHSNQLEILLTWRPDEAAEVGLILAQSPNDEEQTRIVFNRQRGELSIDRRFSHFIGDVDLDTQIATLTIDSEEELKLHIFFDRSVIEVFSNDRVCLTSRIYPICDDSTGISFVARGGTTRLSSVDIWELSSIW
jgi:beta-fructofuranosidase